MPNPASPAGANARQPDRLVGRITPERSSSWENTIVFSAGTSWDEAWPSERHLADEVASFAPVLYVDPPLSIGRSPQALLRRRELRLQQIRPGLVRLTPLALPGMTRSVINQSTAHLLRSQLKWAVAELQASVRALVACQIVYYVFGACEEQSRVLYGTDDFVAGAKLMGLPQRRLKQLERRVLLQSDLVFAVSGTLVDLWRGPQTTPILLPNGCDPEAFRRVDDVQPPLDVHLPRPIVGFSGQLSDRIDVSLLEAVAATGVSLLLVGGRQRTVDSKRFDALLARPNVQWVGPRKFGELPSYLSIMDVGITPYTQSDFNKASFPLKTLEYLAAGLPTVVSDLPTAWSLQEVVRICATEKDFTEGVQAALREPKTAEAVNIRRSVAEQHSWRRRAAQFVSQLGV